MLCLRNYKHDIVQMENITTTLPFIYTEILYSHTFDITQLVYNDTNIIKSITEKGCLNNEDTFYICFTILIVY